ncbi:MAG: sugar phosphate isomerase/epimerase [Clostridia bacterium]|nr:sugar phosphate isomerase/epimerase [Clostridia bacterium]
MRIGIAGGVYTNPENGEMDLAAIVDHGYDCIDLDLCDTAKQVYTLSEEDFVLYMQELGQNIRNSGLRVSQVHGPWPTDDKSEQSRAEKLVYMQRAVRATALVESPYMVVHPVMPFGWSGGEDAEMALAMNIEFFRELCDYAAPYGVGICVENMPFLEQRISTVDRIVELVQLVNRPNFHICLDTGHANVFRHNCGDMVRLCGKYLKVLHVHDNCGKRDSHCIPFDGTVDWNGFTAALKEIGFDGVMSLETKVRRDYPEGMREETLQHLARIARSLANQCK